MSTAVPPGTCVTHGWHGMTTCPRCSTAVGPFTPLMPPVTPHDDLATLLTADRSRMTRGDMSVAIDRHRRKGSGVKSIRTNPTTGEWFDKCQSCGHRRGEHIPYGPGCRAFVSACICPSRASNLGACPIHDGRGNVRGEVVKTAPVSEGRLAADRGESLSGFPHVSGIVGPRAKVLAGHTGPGHKRLIRGVLRVKDRLLDDNKETA